jgi:hypothetical protein
MRVPKRLQEKVDSITYHRGGRFDFSGFDRPIYEVNLAEGWYVGYEGLFYCETKEEVLEVLEDAKFKGADYDG